MLTKTIATELRTFPIAYQVAAPMGEPSVGRAVNVPQRNLAVHARVCELASRGTRTHSRGLLEQSPGEPSRERRARCGRLRRTAKDTLNRARGRRKARLSARLSDQSSIAVYLRRAGGAAAARHCAQTRRRRREPDLSRRVSPARQSGKDRWRLAIGACCARLTAVARQQVVHLYLTLRVWLARGSH